MKLDRIVISLYKTDHSVMRITLSPLIIGLVFCFLAFGVLSSIYMKNMNNFSYEAEAKVEKIKEVKEIVKQVPLVREDFKVINKGVLIKDDNLEYINNKLVYSFFLTKDKDVLKKSNSGKINAYLLNSANKILDRTEVTDEYSFKFGRNTILKFPKYLANKAESILVKIVEDNNVIFQNTVKMK